MGKRRGGVRDESDVHINYTSEELGAWLDRLRRKLLEFEKRKKQQDNGRTNTRGIKTNRS